MSKSKNRRWQRILSRRDFMCLSAQGGFALLLSGCAGGLLKSAPQRLETAGLSDGTETTDEFLRRFSPIDRAIGDLTAPAFSGDLSERPHRVLWDLPGYLTGRKIESEEEAPVVVIGGGVAGLFTAYGLRKHQPILLEQAARFGGNAKGQSWRGLDYSIGSAYVDTPHPGTPMDELHRELELHEILVERKNADPVEYNGKIYAHFWEGETAPQDRSQFDRLNGFFSSLCSEKERPFPFIPSLNAGHAESVRFFDKDSLHSLLSRVAGGKLNPQLETAIEHYCWSTYAGSSKELSAAAALNFLAQESNPILVAAGGNSRIAERVLERLLRDVPRKNLRAGCLAVQVRVEGDRVRVLYEDPQGKLRAVRAKAAVLSCPKFVAAKILEELEPQRTKAIHSLRYRSYMVANLLLKTRVQGNFYDLFMIGGGKTDLHNIRAAQDRMNATDFVLANFAGRNNDVSVLTFYRAFPFDGARDELLQPSSFETYRRKFEKQIADHVLPLLGARQSDIVDLRLTLWGHALPLAAKGLYSGNTVEWLRKPFRDRVFFNEQDNWAYPSVQTGATESVLLKEQISKLLS